jgi:hypothetical protein
LIHCKNLYKCHSVPQPSNDKGKKKKRPLLTRATKLEQRKEGIQGRDWKAGGNRFLQPIWFCCKLLRLSAISLRRQVSSSWWVPVLALHGARQGSPLIREGKRKLTS